MKKLLFLTLSLACAGNLFSSDAAAARGTLLEPAAELAQPYGDLIEMVALAGEYVSIMKAKTGTNLHYVARLNFLSRAMRLHLRTYCTSVAEKARIEAFLDEVLAQVGAFTTPAKTRHANIFARTEAFLCADALDEPLELLDKANLVRYFTSLWEGVTRVNYDEWVKDNLKALLPHFGDDALIDSLATACPGQYTAENALNLQARMLMQLSDAGYTLNNACSALKRISARRSSGHTDALRATHLLMAEEIADPFALGQCPFFALRSDLACLDGIISIKSAAEYVAIGDLTSICDRLAADFADQQYHLNQAVSAQLYITRLLKEFRSFCQVRPDCRSIEQRIADDIAACIVKTTM